MQVFFNHFFQNPIQFILQDLRASRLQIYSLTHSGSRNCRDIVKGEIYCRLCSTVVYRSSTISSASSHTAQRNTAYLNYEKEEWRDAA